MVVRGVGSLSHARRANLFSPCCLRRAHLSPLQYNDRYNVQQCDLVGLTDLDTSSQYVQDQLVDYIETMASMGVAGVRIDAAKHIAASELKQILSRISIYNFMEVIGSGGEAVGVGEYFDIGDVTEFDYAQVLSPNILQDGKLQYLNDFGEAFGLMPANKAVVFIASVDSPLLLLLVLGDVRGEVRRD